MNVTEAIAFIESLQTGQRDWRGQPYHIHDIEVMQMMPAEAPEETKIAALLHGVLDQGLATEASLLAAGVPPRSVEIVKIVTNGPETKGYAAYKRKCTQIAESGDEAAIRIKLADNIANEGHPTNDYTETKAILKAALDRLTSV